MARPSRGFFSKCPVFAPVQGVHDYPQEECIAEHKGHRFRVVRYRKTGRLVSWLMPKRGYPLTRPHGRGGAVPMSTPQTRSLKQLLDESVAFIDRVHARRN
jgi:hypothetical protein